MKGLSFPNLPRNLGGAPFFRIGRAGLEGKKGGKCIGTRIFFWREDIGDDQKHVSVVCSVLLCTQMLIPKLEHFCFYTGSPHMGIFLSPCPFPYGESPYGNGEGSFDAPLSHARVTQILEFWAIQRARDRTQTQMRTAAHRK